MDRGTDRDRARPGAVSLLRSVVSEASQDDRGCSLARRAQLIVHERSDQSRTNGGDRRRWYREGRDYLPTDFQTSAFVCGIGDVCTLMYRSKFTRFSFSSAGTSALT